MGVQTTFRKWPCLVHIEIAIQYRSAVNAGENHLDLNNGIMNLGSYDGISVCSDFCLAWEIPKVPVPSQEKVFAEELRTHPKPLAHSSPNIMPPCY